MQTATMTPADVQDSLDRIDRRITDINAGLRRMHDRQRNTAFHLDRIALRRELMAERTELLATLIEMS